MSALPVPSSPPAAPDDRATVDPAGIDPTKSPPAPRGVQFITLREASYRSAIPVETLARKARGEWSENELAKLTKPQAGGKPCWHVREDADPLFARAKSPAIMPIDWGKFTAAQRDVIHHRRQIIDAWMDARAMGFERGSSERQITDEFISARQEQGDRISRGTLFRWLKKFNSAGQAGLADARLDAQCQDDDRAAFIEELKRQYLSPRQRSVAMCFEKSADLWSDRGQPPPFGIERARQILNGLDKKVIAYHRFGARVYDARFGKFLRGDYRGMESNDLWVSDGHTLNMFVRVPGRQRPIRPTLVSWMDMRSRLVAGWQIVAGSENEDNILTAFKNGVRNCGRPVCVYHDNGEAFCATSLAGRTKRQRRQGVRASIDLGVFPRLEIGVKLALPYNAKAKIIERFHRTVDERFTREFLTYTGGDTSKKPFDLPDNLAADKIPWLDEVIERFGFWLASKYHSHFHHGVDMDGRTPADVYRENLRQARPIADDVLELELSPRTRVTVGRNGIRVNHLEYEAPELDALAEHEVDVLVNLADISQVIVLDLSGRKICQAGTMRRVPRNATKEQLREAMAGQRRDRKRAKDGYEAQLRIADDMTERLRRQAERVDPIASPSEAPLVKQFRSKLKPGRQPAVAAAKLEHAPYMKLADSPDVEELSGPNDLSKTTLDDVVNQMAVNQ